MAFNNNAIETKCNFNGNCQLGNFYPSLMQRNPSRSLECFNYYIPLIDKIAKEYEANYGACVQESEDQRGQAEEATLEQRNDLASRAENSCNVLSQCSEKESAEQYCSRKAANSWEALALMEYMLKHSKERAGSCRNSSLERAIKLKSPPSDSYPIKLEAFTNASAKAKPTTIIRFS
ncbi:hypothetical protein CVS40_5414 [Lucilia cuprina]|nr:hypothetical protein CVS40_5414 [Lucilia cuprina]